MVGQLLLIVRGLEQNTVTYNPVDYNCWRWTLPAAINTSVLWGQVRRSRCKC